MDIENLGDIIQIIENEIITDENDLLKFKCKYRDLLKNLFLSLKNLDINKKKQYGSKINDIKNVIDIKYKNSLEKLNRQKKDDDNYFDFTLPVGISVGNLHPLSLLKNKLISIFSKLGFSICDGPEIEDDFHNFSGLNMPENHPARDMQDTFFIDNYNKNVLRTHTTSVQSRILEKIEMPVRSVSIGRVYRNETVSARSNCFFYQFDGFCVDENISFLDLKYVFQQIINNLFGSDIKMRIRPSYFPFTSPSVEVDISCTVCGMHGCPICKGSGWLEVWGGGMIHENVLKNHKVNYKKYSGFAFGGGLERLTMLLHRIDDLRLFAVNDIRFLRQFKKI